MAVRLNHTIVAARDKDSAAKFLTEILGLPAPTLLGPFAVVHVSADTSLDYHDTDGEITSQHYAFLVDESDFDVIFARRRCLTGVDMLLSTSVSATDYPQHDRVAS